MTFTELRRLIKQIQDSTPAEQLLAAVWDLLKDNWESFDADAEREANRILDGWIAFSTDNMRRELPTQVDGPRRRAATRAIAAAERRHFVTHDAIAVLAGKSKQKAAVIKHSSAAFHRALQTACDFLFDIREGAVRGERSVVLYGLLYGLVDELLVAFHLAERAFVTQVYQHVRAVEEVLEVVDLLAGSDALLEQWLAADDGPAEKKLFRAMRKAAGNAKPPDARGGLYAFLSAAGAHAQFRGLQARASISDNTATFFFAGSPKQIETANVLVVRAAVAFANKVASLFADRLHPEDVKEKLGRCDADLDALARDYLLSLAAQMKLTADEVTLILRVRP